MLEAYRWETESHTTKNFPLEQKQMHKDPTQKTKQEQNEAKQYRETQLQNKNMAIR